ISGFAALTVSSGLGFSGTLSMDGDAIGVSGKFALNGTIEDINVAANRYKVGKTNLHLTNLKLKFGVPGGATNSITGTVSDGGLSASLLADQYVFKTNVSPNAGLYTMILPPETG